MEEEKDQACITETKNSWSGNNFPILIGTNNLEQNYLKEIKDFPKNHP